MNATRSKRTPAQIVLVDDHPVVREPLAQLINQQVDMTVTGSCGTPEECLSLVQKAHPDLVIVDLSLENASGLDLIKQLKEQVPGLAVMVLSMHEESHFIERALRLGARGYVTKQEATQNIITAIRQVLSGRTYLQEKLARGLVGGLISTRRIEQRLPLEHLSNRELAVFQLMGQGWGPRMIAEKLKIDVKTVETHQSRIKEKLNCATAQELRLQAAQWQQLQPPQEPPPAEE